MLHKRHTELRKIQTKSIKYNSLIEIKGTTLWIYSIKHQHHGSLLEWLASSQKMRSVWWLVLFWGEGHILSGVTQEHIHLSKHKRNVQKQKKNHHQLFLTALSLLFSKWAFPWNVCNFHRVRDTKSSLFIFRSEATEIESLPYSLLEIRGICFVFTESVDVFFSFHSRSKDLHSKSRFFRI